MKVLRFNFSTLISIETLDTILLFKTEEINPVLEKTAWFSAPKYFLACLAILATQADYSSGNICLLGAA